MSLYEPLTHYLERRPVPRVSLTFEEIETILGRALPASSRRHQAWWANTPSHTHAEAWMRPGWKTANVDLAGERLAFTRASSPPSSGRPSETRAASATPSAAFSIHAEQLSPAAQRLINDYAVETGGDLAAAIGRAVHEAAIARRRREAELTPLTGVRSAFDSAEAIRRERDER